MFEITNPNRPTIFFHHDPDGVTSALFTYYHLNKKANVKCPEIFGDTDGWKDGDYMVDMRPTTGDIKGTVIDHHPNHIEDRKYELYHEEYPASLITYEMFKEDIPEKDRWKVACGLVGDGQPELIPPEVFIQTP